MKIKLGKDSEAVLKEDISSGVMIEVIGIVQAGGVAKGLRAVLEDTMISLVIDGKDVTGKKMQAFDKVGAKAGGMKVIMAAQDILEEIMDGLDADEKKKSA